MYQPARSRRGEVRGRDRGVCSGRRNSTDFWTLDSGLLEQWGRWNCLTNPIVEVSTPWLFSIAKHICFRQTNHFVLSTHAITECLGAPSTNSLTRCTHGYIAIAMPCLACRSMLYDIARGLGASRPTKIKQSTGEETNLGTRDLTALGTPNLGNMVKRVSPGIPESSLAHLAARGTVRSRHLDRKKFELERKFNAGPTIWPAGRPWHLGLSHAIADLALLRGEATEDVAPLEDHRSCNASERLGGLMAIS